MVNQVVLGYLRTNKGNYRIEDLKKKILSAGYSEQEINEVLNQLAQTEQPKPKKSRKWKWILFGIILLFLIIGAVVAGIFFEQIKAWFTGFLK